MDTRFSNKAALYVLSRPSLSEDWKSFLDRIGEVWRHTGGTDAEMLVEFAGRICYLSFGARQSPKTNREYIHHIITAGHESVLEHASWTFLLEGISRAFSHQLVRHRIGFSFSQLSQQYYDSRGSDLILPKGLTPELQEKWTGLMRQADELYREISESAITPTRNMNKKEAGRYTRSAARSVLPNAIETKLVFSANGRSLRHFLAVRGSTEGDAEMREVSTLIYRQLHAEAPSLVADFSEQSLPDGTPIIAKISGSKD